MKPPLFSSQNDVEVSQNIKRKRKSWWKRPENFTLNEDKSLQADFVVLFLFLFVFFSDLAGTSHWGQEIAMGFGLERRQLRAQSGNKVCHTATTTTKKN